MVDNISSRHTLSEKGGGSTLAALAGLAAAAKVDWRVLARGGEWLAVRLKADPELTPAPIGLYFASLWYSERLYPLIFTTLALGRLRREAQTYNVISS